MMRRTVIALLAVVVCGLVIVGCDAPLEGLSTTIQER